MKRLLLAIGALLALTGAAHASQVYCWSENPYLYFTPIHTSGLAVGTFGTTIGWTTPPDAWCPIAEAGETSNGSVFLVRARCLGTTGSAFRSIEREGFFRVVSGNVSQVDMDSHVVTIGSAALDLATMTMVASGANVVPKVIGVYGEEIDWDCSMTASAFRPAIP